MTNHPTPELLSESALAEIEARPSLWPAHDEWRETPPRKKHVILDAGERDALCATVRALRAAAKAEMERESGLVTDLEKTIITLRDQLAELQRRNDTQAESIMEFQAGEKSLRAQLAQVEEELSDYKDK